MNAAVSNCGIGQMIGIGYNAQGSGEIISELGWEHLRRRQLLCWSKSDWGTIRKNI